MDHIEAYRYDRRRTEPKQVDMIKDRMIHNLLMRELVPQLKNRRIYYAVKLDMFEEDAHVFDLYADMVDIRVRLEINEGEQRIIEYIDYRPMDWMTLSMTATEEVRRRIRNWWHRPLSARLYVWKMRLATIERRHFGYTFDDKKCP